MKFIVYADIHNYGSDPFYVLPMTVDEVESDAIIIGDFVDFKNCLKKNYSKACELYDAVKLKLRDRYRDGNHECRSLVDSPLIINSIAFLHGDSLFWGIVKSVEARRDKPCAGKFSRFYKKWFSRSRKYFDGKLDNATIKRCNEFAVNNPGIKIIVMGHKHPNNIIDYHTGMVRIIVLPRGRHEISLPVCDTLQN